MTEKQKIRDAIFTIAPDWGIAYFRRIEKKKFQDSRRVAIANDYPLTKEQKEQIDELFVSNYGEKIDYVWHKNYAAHAEKFDYRFIPELLFIPEFEAFQNQNRSAVAMMSDKNMLPVIASSVGVKMPKTIVSCTSGLLRDGDNKIITSMQASEIIKNKNEFFVKPTVDTCSGEGCMKVSENCDFHLTRSSLVINGGGYENDFIIQELISCHESISALYPFSVNTFRVGTYIWKGRIETMPLIIRIGQGGHYLDNAHAGGMFCAVFDNGRMGDIAMTEFNKKFLKHPDTQVKFSEHKIAFVDNVIAAAKKMHAAIPQVGLFNWDFTIDKEGEPVLIEANCNGCSVWLPQMAHGVGAFGDKTVEVLQWLRFMKQMKPKDRHKYAGGQMG